MREDELHDLIRNMPKAELHVHLEGSIRPETFLLLANRNNIEVPVHDLAGVREYFMFRDFQHFMQLYGETTYLLATPDDFTLITEQLGEDLATNNVRYAEVTFTPGTHFRFKHLSFDSVMDAIAEGARRAEAQHGVKMRFILDHVRGFPVEACRQTAEWCQVGRDRGVVAMGLAGYEPERPASMYSDVLRWLEREDIAFVPHAGEAVGPEGIWDALRYRPRRIGHGFRAADDPALLVELKQQGIALELCMTSNVRTGVVHDITSHPFRKLWDSGVPLTINTDDPTMFNTTMNNEYSLASTAFGLTASDLARISFTAVKHALVDTKTRNDLLNDFRSEFTALGVTTQG